MITDFVLSLDGVIAFRPPTWNRDPQVSGTEAYFKRRADLKQDRVLFMGSAGVKGGDFESVRNQLVTQMRQLAGGRLQKAGVLCLFGSSNGAAHALALAAVLQNELTINYICLADLPLFAGGSNPPIPGIGALAPSRPATFRRAFSLAGSIEVRVEGDRPKVSFQPEINAKLRQNFYQHSGNAAKTTTFSGEWFWTSDMKNHEVHGVITNADWSNQEITGLTIDNPRLRAIVGGEGDAFHAEHNSKVEMEIWGKRWPKELANI